MLKLIHMDGSVTWVNPAAITFIFTLSDECGTETHVRLQDGQEIRIEGDRANLIAHHCAALLDKPTYTMDARDVDIVA